PVKRASYLLPVYPFITIFLAQYALHITEYRHWCTRIFALFMAIGVLIGLIVILLPTPWAVIPVLPITVRTCLLLAFTLAMTITVIYYMFKKINIKILYATIALTFAVNLFINAVGIS
ncbi:MAG TPA: dolichyl-phosphate-mannose--protein mannosyltransferase, partial [Candidatus Parabacteroides intestinavium]|nr:dolichyl-phosphate-mannose--protein mannosyltransferase [Candidatus Parabacteroides intestinavium]